MPRLSLPADLIASEVEYLQALSLATDAQKEAINTGRASIDVVDQISSSVMIRTVLSDHMTDEELKRYIQHLQNRFRGAAGEPSYSRYVKDLPPNVFESRDLMEAEFRAVAYRLRLVYCITAIRDQKIYAIRIGCAIILAIVLSILIFKFLEQAVFSVDVPLFNCFGVASIGLAGAATSVARRADKIVHFEALHDDPVVQASALDKAVTSLAVAVLCGPVFALLLMTLFMTQVFTFGQLTPSFSPDGRAINGGRCVEFELFTHCFALVDKSSMGAAKLAVWSFVAGFAEQFVPDVLDRFTRSADQSRA